MLHLQPLWLFQHFPLFSSLVLSIFHVKKLEKVFKGQSEDSLKINLQVDYVGKLRPIDPIWLSEAERKFTKQLFSLCQELCAVDCDSNLWILLRFKILRVNELDGSL